MSQVQINETAKPVRKKKVKLVAVVNPTGCTGCEVCIEFCPVDCIYKVKGPEFIDSFNGVKSTTFEILRENVEKGINPFSNVNGIVIVDEDICIGCKLCAKYCPWETIDMVSVDSD
jgi:electron transport complex protein RnfB